VALARAPPVGAAPALGAPPPWAGGGKHGDAGGGEDRHERKAKSALDDRADPRAQGGNDVGKGAHYARKPLAPGVYFDNGNRDAVRRYYASHPPKPCPPGLAKKNNGCLPPGQAKNWQIGQPLPATVVVQPVPQPILVSLPKVPPGHKYVQVAGDILLIAVGSKMVVDGINGLMSR
jgi:hypothetical protein